MNRLLFLLTTLLLFSACNNTDSSGSESQDTTAPAKENPLTANPNMDVEALAKEACNCVKKLTEERDMIKKFREEGNKGEALKLITNNRKTQKAAFDCSKPYIEKIRYNKDKYPAFENAMLSKCPQGGTALLIMHEIHYKE